MDTSKWKWFRVGDIFQVKAGKYHYKDEYESGNTPYLSATAVNNGVGERINLSPEFEGGVITTEKVKCTAFYQPQPFCATSDVNIIKRKDGRPINQYVGLFLSSIIDFNESFRWTYGRQCRVNDTENIRIKLPVTSGGTPDWQYMETFVKDQIIPQLPKKAQRVWLKKYDTKPLQDMKMKLNTDEWKWFVIKDIFDVKAGRYHYPEEYESGDTPYLSATAVNNGVGEQISLSPEFEGGVITTEKVKCTAFYQPKSFCATSDVNIIKRKDGQPINQYVGLFLTSIINFNESFRWTYGRQCRVNDTENIRIKLPVTPEGTPDWQFMEDYIKSLPFSKNIEPSKPNEVVDELMEVKKRVIEMQNQLAAQQQASINNYGTVNIYEK